MSVPYTAEHVAGLVIARCETNGEDLSRRKLQAVMYFVQTQFVMEDSEVCFKNPIYVDEKGPYIREIETRLADYPEGLVPYEILTERFPFDKKLDPHSMAVINRAVDAAASLPENELIRVAANQLPYRKALLTDSKKILVSDIKKFFGKI